jgi:hypothetical protein
MSLFQESWWLDAVAPGAWSEIVVEKGGEVHARCRYVVKKRFGLTLLTMPQLTPHLGPWMRPYEGKYANRLAEEKELMTALIDQLPRYDLFLHRFDTTVTNWLPFYWKGFHQTTGYTYVVPDLHDPDAVWRETRDNVRTDVRKAEKRLCVRDESSIETFLDINELTFRRQGMALPYTRELVRAIDAACRERNCRRIIVAEDAQGRIHAAAYIVWDTNAAYYLMGGADPSLRNSGAMSLVIWNAIQFAATVTRSFDFEGSMMEPVERFCRSFGARQTPYSTVSRMSRRMRFLMGGRDMLQALRGGA